MSVLSQDFLEKIKDKENFISYIHMSDSHSGYRGNSSRYNEYAPLRIDKTNQQGINIRQADIDAAFNQVMDLAINTGVDLVLHAGDGWDAVGYPDRTVDNAYTKMVTRLYEKNIHYVEIVGNHNLPKKVGKGCFLESLGRYPLVHTVYKGFYEKISLFDDLVHIHCIPSTFNQEILDESFEEAKSNKVEGKINIGLSHVAVTNIEHYAKNAEKTLITTLDNLIDCGFDYFALGDFHEATAFTDSIRYSGSIERMGMGEVKNTPLVYIAVINKHTKELSVEEFHLDVRPMIDLPIIDAENKSIEAVNEEIQKVLKSKDITDAIVRLRVYKLPLHLKSHIDVEMIEELTAHSMFFKLELREKKEESMSIRTSDDIEFEGILEGWIEYLKKIEDDGSFDKKLVTELGYQKLSSVLER